MKRIGLVPMSGKPVHAGHWGLIEIAAEENDEVRLFISTSDRKRPGEITILGASMKRIWDAYLEPALPDNVVVTYGGSPVGNLYAELEDAEANDSEDTYVIYSDKEDILKYTDESLGKVAPALLERGQIELRGVDRNETVNVSGTKMREMLASGNVKAFESFLPSPVQQHAAEIIDILTGDVQRSPTKKAGRKRKTAAEALLRSYVRSLLRS